MVNINKKIIDKINVIEKDADKILSNANNKAQSILSKAKFDAPTILKEMQEIADKDKSQKIDDAKIQLESETAKIILNGNDKIKTFETKIKSKIDLAADAAVKIFINKINGMDN